ncbi:MAG TPA: histidine--tRNA ligase [Devosia sp.]|jgi:histidyl-tRNA synthetase|nr:histidine--tRNA ligase [Devosia sp.]
MADRNSLIEARLPRGFEDRSPADIQAVDRMIATVKSVYERYGFDPVETPLLEYTETLGKFLPDTDRPNAGVFSLQDDDEQWMSLRYDLTAPLARYFSQNYDRLPKPFRSYRAGYVFRNEKPGPGRFRQFMQFDADTVGAADPEADAEMCMMMADTMDALGLSGKYVVRANNRKVLDAVLAGADVEGEGQKLAVLRSIDKLDKFGPEGVELLLGEGRKDESGDFTKGAGLDAGQRRVVLDYIAGNPPGDGAGVAELAAMQGMFDAAGYGADRIRIDPSVVRGLEYYTGPVFEIELTFQVPNEKGQPVVFGSVGGGGRYDGLVSRFRSEPVPATGFSIGVSRLANALKMTGLLAGSERGGPVVILVLDRDPAAIADYQKMTAELRAVGIRAEMYLGSSGMNAQMKYADRRNAAAAVIVGTNERADGVVTIKDLEAGAEQARAIKDNAEYKAARPGQWTAARADLVAELTKIPAVARMRSPG